tara:strand:- start:2552 stop:2707 length:156 start_codon:yes stop_codon:yes gene_type:complete
MDQDTRKETSQNALIKSNLKRAFDAQASKELPPELIALIAKLNEQDIQDKT